MKQSIRPRPVGALPQALCPSERSPSDPTPSDPTPAPSGPAPRSSDPRPQAPPARRMPHVTPGRGPALLRPSGGCPYWISCGAAVCACAARCGACARKLGAACEAERLSERLSGPARSARPGPAARLCPPAGLALRSWPVPARWARSQAVGQSRGPWVCKYHRPRVFCVGGGARAGAVGLGAAVWTPRAQPPSCLLPELGRGGARAAARGED